ncbi:ORC-CDC6 family AAA ATPase [Bradyrhizobium sp. WSM471]|uniref:ORC-CDC6 family AAA ATPase n=1 Tax=Bradyrhizobium sp. WSM471 TaxID=319017 RepID=UPI00024D1A7E|nr:MULTISPECIES: hypothetical protein [Bradyrhizobium]EHQ99919.1 hypothetical protein Bra471DRAFT_00454 [Bradyrhizobium sp. WSM471]UFW42055.1 hypothetical protein BcanWSM471_02245 [Bradyrhizobium canariense]
MRHDIEQSFGVLSPEQLDSSYIAENFVDVFTDLPRVRDFGNTFIAGARGTGKSMLLRSLEPEVMMKSNRAKSLADLPYLSVHVPLRKAEFGVTELRRLAGYASIAIGEHLLSMQVSYRLAALLESLAHSIEKADAKRFAGKFRGLLNMGGGRLREASVEKNSELTFAWVKDACEAEIVRVRQYYTRLPFGETTKNNYEGALVGFLDFIVPLALELSKFRIFGKMPIFVMLDDADNLPQHLQRVINSWVSTRSTHAVCLKITTQLGYATYRTVDNRLIESPHDFTEVNLSTIYTNEFNTYSNRIEEIVNRRLKLAGISRSAADFFPRDEQQAERLMQIQQEIKDERQAAELQGISDGSARSRDHVARYAVPRLMRELAGSSRSSHTYSYAGFRSMVDLSSGVIRWFLEPASRMYDRVVSEKGEPVDCVPVSIQDRVLVDWATEFVQKLSAAKVERPSDDVESDEADPDASLHALGHETEIYERLRNLLDGLGMLFRSRLLDETASEQRAFSVVLRDKPKPDLRQVLDLGIRLGYLQTADNAAKEALGARVPRYVLARRLAPYYRLDVSGYAAHLSVMSEDLDLATKRPAEFAKKKAGASSSETSQLKLDFEEDK